MVVVVELNRHAEVSSMQLIVYLQRQSMRQGSSQGVDAEVLSMQLINYRSAIADEERALKAIYEALSFVTQ